MPPHRSRRPTQRDIAELAGVSITTVSHVVNGTRAVAPETRTAVLDAVERTGYTGDAVARSLVTGGTTSIGVATSLATHPSFATLLQAIEAEAAAAGYTVLLADTADTAEDERAVVRTMRARRIDGLLLRPATDSAVVDELVTHGMPTVLLDRLATRGDVDQVGPENIQATSTLTEHLASRGHRRVGFISGAPEPATNDERVLGYRLGLGRAKLPWDEDLVADGHVDRTRSAAALARLLTGADPPTAVVVGGEEVLPGVLAEARRRGLRLGADAGDLALACYGDPEWADLVDPPLTTMAPAISDIGREATRLLLNRIADPGRDPETVRLPPELRHRGSCGCRPAVQPVTDAPEATAPASSTSQPLS